MYQLRIYLVNGKDYRVLEEGTKEACDTACEARRAEQDKKFHSRFKVEEES